MISTYLSGQSVDTPMKEIRGLSTDTKPVVGIPNGSTFFEINTGKLFCFDADNSFWYEIAIGGSGGGGASQADLEAVRDMICDNVEGSTTASSDYAVGDYLVINNVLYKVTDAITAGDTITEGTNVEVAVITNNLGGDPGYGVEKVYYVQDASLDDVQEDTPGIWELSGFATDISDLPTNYQDIIVEVDSGIIYRYTDQSTIESWSDSEGSGTQVTYYDEDGNQMSVSFFTYAGTGNHDCWASGTIASNTQPQTISVYEENFSVSSDFADAVNQCYTETVDASEWIAEEQTFTSVAAGSNADVQVVFDDYGESSYDESKYYVCLIDGVEYTTVNSIDGFDICDANGDAIAHLYPRIPFSNLLIFDDDALPAGSEHTIEVYTTVTNTEVTEAFVDATNAAIVKVMPQYLVAFGDQYSTTTETAPLATEGPDGQSFTCADLITYLHAHDGPTITKAKRAANVRAYYAGMSTVLGAEIIPGGVTPTSGSLYFYFRSHEGDVYQVVWNFDNTWTSTII